MIFRLGELFSGPGGLAWGAVHSQIEKLDFCIVHAWANELDRDTCDTYIRNICPDHPETVLCEDVRALDISHANPRLTPIDALAFGFPCNDFSLVGEQKGFSGKYGALYSYGVKTLRIFQPQWFLAENVSGLSSADNSQAFPLILSELHDAGYRCYPHLYKFEEYGVPQARHRIIIVGIRKDLPFQFAPPAPTTAEKPRTARQALTDPPIPMDVANHEIPATSSRVRERLSYIQPGQNVFQADMPEHLRLKVKGATISQIYRRLDPDKPSYTVTGSGGGGTHIYHYDMKRFALTNRERARLQTFQDSFVFLGSRGSVRKQIGMAVPPLGAKQIFEAILRTFAGISYPSVSCNIAIS